MVDSTSQSVHEFFGRHSGYAYAGLGVHSAIGNFTLTEIDLPVADGLLAWTRTYNSRDDDAGVHGRGWTAAHEVRLEFEADRDVLLHDRDGRVLRFEHTEGGYSRPQDLDADLRRTDDGYELLFFCGELWSFTSEGRARFWSYEGRRVVFERDGAGRLIVLRHSTGRRIQLDYNRDGLVEDIRSDDGRVVRYDYDGRLLRTATGPDGAVSRYAYSREGWLTSATDPDGAVLVTNTYDRDGRVRRQEFAGAGGVDFEYRDNRTEVTITPGGHRVLYEHNGRGRPVAVTDPAGNRTTVGYTDDGRVSRATMPSGVSVERSFDRAGNLTASSIDGTTTRWEYDDAHRMVRMIDPVGSTTRFGYTGAGRVPTSIIGPDGAETRYEVANGLVTARDDPDGGRQSYEYDELRNLAAVTDANGFRTRYDHDAAGRRTQVTTPRLLTTRFEYAAAGHLLAVVDTDGGRSTYRYSSAGRLLELTDQTGAAVRYTYDEHGRLATTTDRGGAVTRYGYDELGNVATASLPNGSRLAYGYDALGRLAATSVPLVGTTRLEYDVDGNMVLEDGPRGTIRTVWDARGNRVRVVEPGDLVWNYDYDGLDRLTTVTDPTGAVWRTDFNDETNTVVETDPLGARTITELTPSGRDRAVIDALGRRTTYGYDASGRLVDIVDPEGGRTHFAYDGDGRLLSRTTPAGVTTRFEYETGRRVAAVDPRGWITRFRYDARGRRTAMILPSGTRWAWAYDAAGRLVQVTDPRGGVTRYRYDAVGDLVTVTDAKGAVTRYTHDEVGRRTSMVDPLGRATRFEYDVAGNRVAEIDPSGHEIRLEYDDAGRLVRRRAEDGTEISYVYDKTGRRTSMTDQTGTTRYGYDKAGRPTTVTYPDGPKLVVSYDQVGQRVKLTYPDDATLRYRYDLNGSLVGLSDSEAGEAVYAVDPDGRLITEQLPGGWSRRYSYDGGLLAGFEERRAGVPTLASRLGRDPDGRIVVRHDETESWHYGYDPAGELVTITRASGEDREETQLSYDIAGNRTHRVHDGTATRYLYDIADQLVAVETDDRRIDFDYDGAGRLVEEFDGDIRHRIEYDGLGRPAKSVRTRAWAVEQFHPIFNGDGLLSRLTLSTGDDDAPNTDVSYRWSLADPVPEILTQRMRTDVPQADHTSPLGRELASARFTYGYGRTFATTGHGSVPFARDVFGSAVATEATRPWVLASSYDAFGNTGYNPARPPLLRPEIPRFGFRGELAYSPMVNLRARTYDATLGRFTTRDPVTLHGHGTLANQPYAYAGNDPLNKVDPLGTWAIVQSAWSFLARLVVPFGLGCADCPDAGHSIKSHLKCFQDRACLYTRGYFGGNQSLLMKSGDDDRRKLWRRGGYWHERAVQGRTIAELTYWRGSFGDWWFNRIPREIDWEVGGRAWTYYSKRLDIMTDERDILEVKEWTGPSTIRDVQDQLEGYKTDFLTNFTMDLTFSTELDWWATTMEVGDPGFLGTDLFGDSEQIYIWGLGNLPGHIYFSSRENAKEDAKAYADFVRSMETIEEALELLPFIVLRRGVPVPR
jgi:RHS repeat-associated protein